MKPCGSNWVQIKGPQLKINLHRPVVHRMLIKNGKKTTMIQCILKELLECKVHEKCLCLLMSAFFLTLSCINSVRKHQITMVLCQYLIGIQCTISLCNRSSKKVFDSQTITMKTAWERQNRIGNFPAKKFRDFRVITMALSVPWRFKYHQLFPSKY